MITIKLIPECPLDAYVLEDLRRRLDEDEKF